MVREEFTFDWAPEGKEKEIVRRKHEGERQKRERKQLGQRQPDKRKTYQNGEESFMAHSPRGDKELSLVSQEEFKPSDAFYVKFCNAFIKSFIALIHNLIITKYIYMYI